jgi:hypothetical protein
VAFLLEYVLPILVAVGVFGGCGDDDGESSIESLCARGCAVTESLDCPNDPADCQAECLSEYEAFPPACRSQALAFAECAANRPVADFECDEDGVSTTRDGVCDTEATAAALCLFGG